MNEVVHGGLDDRELRALGLDPAGVLDLSANLHPDGPPPAVIEAFRTADVSRYPSPDAAPLRQAIAALHEVDERCVIVTPGASTAIYLVLSALAAPGDRCAIFPPTFGEYARGIEATGAAIVPYATAPPRFSPSLTTDVDLAVLCNPNNPTGRHLARTEVEAIAARAGVLVLDAAYDWAVEDPWDATELVREGASVVVIHSMTKLFAMPGLRVGYILAPPEITDRVRLRQPPWPVGAPEIAAGLAAIGTIEERRHALPDLQPRRGILEATFNALGCRTTASAANFVLAEVGDAPAFRSAMLARGFAVRDATSFGLPAWVRIAVPPEAHLSHLTAAIEACLRPDWPRA